MTAELNKYGMITFFSLQTNKDMQTPNYTKTDTKPSIWTITVIGSCFTTETRMGKLECYLALWSRSLDPDENAASSWAPRTAAAGRRGPAGAGSWLHLWSNSASAGTGDSCRRTGRWEGDIVRRKLSSESLITTAEIGFLRRQGRKICLITLITSRGPDTG